jgi:hypothetical protein
MKVPNKNAGDVKARQITQWDEATLRQQIFHVFDRDGVEDLEEPKHIMVLRWATLIFMLLVVAMVCINIIVSSLPEYQPAPPPVFETINLACVFYFTVEYLLRVLCAPSPVSYLFNPLNLQDLFSIVPFYLQLGGVFGEGVTNWILITRSVRLARGLLYFRNYEIVTNTVGESSEVVTLMVLIMIVGLPLSGTVMYYAERGSFNATDGAWYRDCYAPNTCDTQRSPFQNAGDGMWYFIVTATTLGYGDYTPTGRAGKLFGGLLTGVGVMLLAYPIMILSVNFDEERRKEERERTLGRVADGERLRTLQLARSSLLDDDSDAFERPGPFYFYPPEINQPRALTLINEEEARYEPLFYIQRNRDGSLYMLQAIKTSLEVSIRLVFDTKGTQALGLETVSHYWQNESGAPVRRARFFPVVKLMFSLDKPASSNCEFLKRLRLVNHVIDEIDLDVTRLPVALELNGMSGQLDDQRKLDFHQALHRCRLHCTALVAHNDPIYFEVPIYMGLLSATALLRELQAKGNGVVYVTLSQIEELLQGVHHLIDLDQPVPTYIINPEDIRKTIANQIKMTAASECEEPELLKNDAFLYGYLPSDEKYYGVFVNRISKKLSGKKDDSEYVLCYVKVLAVQPTAHHMAFLL